jgi:hypothetical protein
VLKRVVAVGICILAVMIAIKDGRVLHSSGLTGSCTAVQTRTDGSELEACQGGKLEGRPDLSHRGCISFGIRGKLEYWHCPADLQAGNAGR